MISESDAIYLQHVDEPNLLYRLVTSGEWTPTYYNLENPKDAGLIAIPYRWYVRRIRAPYCGENSVSRSWHGETLKEAVERALTDLAVNLTDAGLLTQGPPPCT